MLLFIFLAICGFIILTFSLVFGHDADHDGGHHFGEGDGVSVFSTKVIALFVTGFGASGAIAAYYKFSIMFSSLIGIIFGMLMGGLGYFMVNLFYKQQADSSITTAELIGQVGALSVGIAPNGVGEVTVQFKGQTLYYPAKSKDGSPITSGGVVKIVESIASMVVVEPLK